MQKPAKQLESRMFFIRSIIQRHRLLARNQWSADLRFQMVNTIGKSLLLLFIKRLAFQSEAIMVLLRFESKSSTELPIPCDPNAIFNQNIRSQFDVWPFGQNIACFVGRFSVFRWIYSICKYTTKTTANKFTSFLL